MSTQAPTALSQQHEQDDILDIDDVIGKRIIESRLHGNLTIREENAIAALEVMSRFASNPKWLIYLPPTMSPSETAQEPGLLEHPGEAFAYYRHQGVPQVICEEKHMGSRAVVIVCRDERAPHEGSSTEQRKEISRDRLHPDLLGLTVPGEAHRGAHDRRHPFEQAAVPAVIEEIGGRNSALRARRSSNKPFR